MPMTRTPPSRMTRDELRQAWEQERERARLLEQQLSTTTATERVAVNTRLTRGSRDRLRELALERGVTLREIIQTAVDQYIDQHDDDQHDDDQQALDLSQEQP